MKRQLNPKFAWTPEQIELENLDWQNNPDDFEKLYQFVLSRFKTRCKLDSLETQLTRLKLEQAIREAASLFEERFTSLPMFVYLRTKEFVAKELKKG